MASLRACFVFGIAAVQLAACSPVRIPYDLSGVKVRPKPVHARRLAILPLDDARDPKERGQGDGKFVYRGLAYKGTELEQLSGRPLYEVTEVIGQHLARSRLFSQVVLLRNVDQAEDGDLILSGRIRRLRGYVEAGKPNKKSGRPENERKVVAEAFLDGLRIKDTKGRLLYDGATGWSLQDKRMLDAEGEAPSPWSIVAEVMKPAMKDLEKDLADADLSGDFIVVEEAQLTATATVPSDARPFATLPASLPAGWRLASTSTGSQPHGWKGNKDCIRSVLEAKQVRRFSRWQGPYTPSVHVWRCPMQTNLRYDARAEFPADYLGTSGGGHYFGWQLGETTWSEAGKQVARFLSVTPPSDRHVFQVGGRAKQSPTVVPKRVPKVGPARSPLKPKAKS